MPFPKGKVKRNGQGLGQKNYEKVLSEEKAEQNKKGAESQLEAKG